MKGCLRYLGEIPVMALKREWLKGKEVSVQELFQSFGSRCTATESLDMKFIEWFYNTYVKNLGNDFEFVLDDETPDEDVKLNMVRVESSSVNVGTSVEEVTARLKQMHHPDAVGHIKQEKVEMKTNATKSEEIKAIPKPFSTVMTGDDLERSRSQSNSIKSKTAVLSPAGNSVAAIPTSKEVEAANNARLADLSGRVAVLMESDLLDNSRVIVGGTDIQKEDKVIPHKEKDHVKGEVNANFVGFPTEGMKKEIMPEDIARNPNENEALRLIKMCKDKTTLKVAKIYCHEIGKQKLVEKLEQRLRELPPY